MKLSVWFHLYAAGAWETPTREFFDAAINSGLTQEIDAIHVVLVGPPESRRVAREYCRSRTAVVVEREADEAWEQLTLEALRVNPGGDAILYAHTKGAWSPGAANDQWRRSMFLSLVTEWRQCVAMLEEVEAVGCHWLTPRAYPGTVTKPYFGGNMWWARANLIATLEPCAMDERYDAEQWIGTGVTKLADRTPGWPSPATIRREAVRPLRVGVVPADKAACGYIRLRWPAEELQRQGHDIHILEGFEGVWERGEDRDRVVDIRGDCDFDLAVLQRVYRPEILDLVKVLKRRGVAVCIDIDDDLLALPPDHFLYMRAGEFIKVLREAIPLADMVTVSTPALARRYYGRNGAVRVVPNGIPKGYLDLGRTTPRQVPVVGWTGMVQTHPGDLDMVGTAIAELCGSGGPAVFRGIGDPTICDFLGVPRPVGQYQEGRMLGEDYGYARLYADLDIAIVPLKQHRFNTGKSWLKGLEAAALGVPFVASPTPEYEKLHNLGAGLLAESPKEWKAQLGRLIASADLRAELAAKGREVAATLTTENFQSPLLWTAWQEALAASRLATPRRAGPYPAAPRTALAGRTASG